MALFGKPRNHTVEYVNTFLSIDRSDCDVFLVH